MPEFFKVGPLVTDQDHTCCPCVRQVGGSDLPSSLLPCVAERYARRSHRPTFKRLVEDDAEEVPKRMRLGSDVAETMPKMLDWPTDEATEWAKKAQLYANFSFEDGGNGLKESPSVNGWDSIVLASC